MSPLRFAPPTVPSATVRRLTEDVPEVVVPVQQVAVPTVPAANVVPRQLDPVGLRLVALQLEVEELRAELERRSA